MLLGIEQVKNFLPHREPFLFIDSVESISGVQSQAQLFDAANVVENEKELLDTVVYARYFVNPQLDLFRGHFPGRPVLPGVIQIEMMAQASCFGVIRLYKDPQNANVQVAFGKVENAKFRKPIYPGTDLLIYAKLIKIRGEVVGFDCEILDSADRSTLLSQCSILATITINNEMKKENKL